MAKAVLVIDMPKCCIECGFSQRTYETWVCIARERFEKGDWRIEDIKKNQIGVHCWRKENESCISD